MATADTREVVDVAFAMGGFGGNNFHGLGVLDAALETGVEPEMISCTSGQIDIVWKYLLAKKGRLGNKYGVKDLAALAELYLKIVEIKPKFPFPEILSDVPELLAASIAHLTDVRTLVTSPIGYFMNNVVNNLPARTLAPNIKDGVLKEIAKDFNDAPIGIAFNAYNPTSGKEDVYLNPAAQTLLQRPAPRDSSFRATTQYQPITPEGLLNALWIYEYGFKDRKCIDGAYFRMVMLSEISRARTIFVARPIQTQWTDKMPVTYGEKDDLKTEIFFNASYAGERHRIELVNRHLKEGAFTQAFIDREGYHPIEFYEIEPRTAQPFVTYFTEDIEQFNEAYEDAKEVFEGYLTKSGSRRPTVAKVAA